MDDFVALFRSDPIKALACAAVLLAGFLFLELKRRFSHDIIRFETTIESFAQKMSYWETQIRNHMGQTGKDLLKHSEDMGKATKAISGDMLKIQEHVFNMKQSIVTEIESLKKFSGSLEREFLAFVGKTENISETLTERFGRIIEVKKELEIQLGKVVQIEENTGKQTVRLAKHEDHFAKIALSLSHQKEKLTHLEAELAKMKRGKV